MEFRSNTIADASFAMAENPIIVEVGVGSTDFPDGCTSRKCEITVDFTYDGSAYSIPFETITYNGDVVAVDIRSAFTAWVLGNRPVPNIENGTVMPWCAVTIKVKLKYMTYGSTKFTYVSGSLSRSVKVLPGGFSEMELLQKGVGQPGELISQLVWFTKMPIKGRVWAKNDSVIMAKISDRGMTYKRSELTLAGLKGNNTSENIPSFMVEEDEDRVLILFINSFGVMETVSAKCLESLGNNVESETYELAEKPTFVPNSKIASQSVVGAKQYEMSSGYVTEEWREYWLSEVLGSSSWWIVRGGVYVPVALSAKSKSTNAWDKKDDVSLVSVEFVMKLGLKG